MQIYLQPRVSDHSTEFGAKRLRYGHGSPTHLLILCDFRRLRNQIAERNFLSTFKSYTGLELFPSTKCNNLQNKYIISKYNFEPLSNIK